MRSRSAKHAARDCAQQPELRRAFGVTLACLATMALASCVHQHSISIAMPIEAKLDISRFKRVLVASFVTRTDQALDLDTETVRLLRNQLKSQIALPVIEADLPPLGDFSDWALKQSGEWEAYRRLEKESRAQTGERISREEWIDLEEEKLLGDTDYWRRVGEEYQEPLIVTGRLRLVSASHSVLVASTRDATTAKPQEPERATFEERMAYSLMAEFLFIDGGNGELVHRARFKEEVLYGPKERVSGLASYFELVDRVLPQFMLLVSSQNMRVTRTLLE